MSVFSSQNEIYVVQSKNLLKIGAKTWLIFIKVSYLCKYSCIWLCVVYSIISFAAGNWDGHVIFWSLSESFLNRDFSVTILIWKWKIALLTNLQDCVVVMLRPLHHLAQSCKNFEDIPSKLGSLEVFRQDKIFLVVSNVNVKQDINLG